MRDRVESKRAEKILLFIKIMIAVVVILPIVIVLWNFEHIATLRWYHFKEFFLGLFLLIPNYIAFTKLKGQFIEWSDEQILFKTKGAEGAIMIDQIKNVIINLDSVVLESNNGDNFILNIQDFGGYEARLRIKNNFQTISSLVK